MEKINYYLQLLKEKDLYTYHHCLRVCDYSCLIGKNMNLPISQLKKLRKASLLHDIGKLLIPTIILNKKEPLTDEEYNIIKKHTVYAKRLLYKYDHDIVFDIICHHERLNGSGYPYRTKKIPLNAQIIAIADSFDAMTTSRGYNKVLSHGEAFLELFNCSEKNIYNKKLVEVFLKSLVT